MEQERGTFKVNRGMKEMLRLRKGAYVPGDPAQQRRTRKMDAVNLDSPRQLLIV
jgi:hypothetical protein